MVTTVNYHTIGSLGYTVLAFAVPFRQLPVYQRDETVDE
jgi:hypothetical protein